MPDLSHNAFAIIDEGVNWSLADRVVRLDGQDLLPSDVVKWSIAVYDARNVVDGAELYELVDQPATTPPFYSSLQPPQGVSSKPFNFNQIVPATGWTQVGGLRYITFVKIETAQFGRIVLRFTVQLKAVP